ncbi:hypothetical protein BKA70DRAFT_5808 [Coprinopsis sp. MPI-PUGE-AT-0042]|nr:hypothetical protein BKA70DRAFT_5808 [Coprinopsis sp. MPI-PUGE-AT-0042]
MCSCRPSLYVRKKRKDDCARPDCKVRKRLEVGEFFVEAIIGRAPSAKPGEFTYLVEWRGYHIKEATWEPSLPNPMPFVRTFTAKAKQEGLDLSNPHDTVLLAVAKPHHS